MTELVTDIMQLNELVTEKKTVQSTISDATSEWKNSTSGHMWQSRVEIEHYSVAYFYRITAFEALQRKTSVKGEAHTHCVNVLSIHEFIQCV